jgi:aromatic-L-amino-acid/L-tryptophan decarboxylase
MQQMLKDMAGQEFREAGQMIIDWIAAYRDEIESYAVLPQVEPGWLYESFSKKPPENAGSMEQIFEKFVKVIMPGVTHWNHPKFLAYFSISSSGPAVLAELLAAALNVNGMLWKTCPALTELEKITLDWLRQMIGLAETFWGIAYDTASTSTFHAIAAARQEISPENIREKGLYGSKRLILYTSDQAHSSVEKAAIALGLGLENVCKIKTDDEFRLRVDLLHEHIRRDRKNGHLPFCVVATVGTTSTTSIDPIPEISAICREEKLWLHVDAAYGGSAAIVPEYQNVLEGCEEADSLVMNPHKWLFVPIDFSAFYTRKPAILKEAFSLIPEYLRTSEDHRVENLMDYGMQLGRRFRALKLWFVLQYFGRQGIINRIRNAIEMAQDLANKIEQHPDFEKMAPTPFSTICFRAHPHGLNDAEKLNHLNKELLQTINKEGEYFISHTKLNEQYVIRIAVGNIQTDQHHMNHLWDILQKTLPMLYKNE